MAKMPMKRRTKPRKVERERESEKELAKREDALFLFLTRDAPLSKASGTAREIKSSLLFDVETKVTLAWHAQFDEQWVYGARKLPLRDVWRRTPRISSSFTSYEISLSYVTGERFYTLHASPLIEARLIFVFQLIIIQLIIIRPN